jgi:hypothetical protein
VQCAPTLDSKHPTWWRTCIWDKKIFSLNQYVSLILDFHHDMNTDFWFWGFSMVCEVNFPTTFRKPLWVPPSLVLSQNVNEQWSRMLPCIGVEWVWVELAIFSSGQSDLRRTSGGEGVFEEKQIPLEGGRCIRCQCRCGGGRLDESMEQNTVMRNVNINRDDRLLPSKTWKPVIQQLQRNRTNWPNNSWWSTPTSPFSLHFSVPLIHPTSLPHIYTDT